MALGASTAQGAHYGLEAIAETDEEGAVLARSLSYSVLEIIRHTDLGTDAQVELAVLDGCGGVEPSVEALVGLVLEDVLSILHRGDGGEAVGEARTSLDRDREGVGQADTDTEVDGDAEVVEADGVLDRLAEDCVLFLSTLLTEDQPRGEVDARGQVDFGSNTDAETGTYLEADIRTITSLSLDLGKVESPLDTRMDGLCLGADTQQEQREGCA